MSRDTQRNGGYVMTSRDWSHASASQQMPRIASSQQEREAWNRPSLQTPRKNQSCQHLDLDVQPAEV